MTQKPPLFLVAPKRPVTAADRQRFYEEDIGGHDRYYGRHDPEYSAISWEVCTYLHNRDIAILRSPAENDKMFSACALDSVLLDCRNMAAPLADGRPFQGGIVFGEPEDNAWYELSGREDMMRVEKTVMLSDIEENGEAFVFDYGMAEFREMLEAVYREVGTLCRALLREDDFEYLVSQGIVRR